VLRKENIISFIGKAVGYLTGAQQQADAAQTAAGIQSGAVDKGIAQQNKMLDILTALQQPYMDTGKSALGGQGDLLGLNGADKQAAAIAALQGGPQFQALQQQGENSILANASATGGLRGGNTQGALAQFSPMLLSQLITDQYSRLGGLTSLGQNAAALTGNQGVNVGSNISTLLQQQGAAQAGGALAQGKANAGMPQTIGNILGMFMGGGSGLGGFKGF
jgi:hypothetical protein